MLQRTVALAAIGFLVLSAGAAAMARGRGHHGKAKISQRQPFVPNPTQRYEQIWQRVAPGLGAQGQPSPQTQPGELPYSQVGAGPNGIRQVNLGADDLRMLSVRTRFPRRALRKNPKLRAKLARNRFWQTGVEKNLAHEFAHVYQRPDLLTQGRDSAREQQATEQGANAFADAEEARFANSRAIRKAHKAGDRKRVRKLRQRPMPPIDTSQFGNNYGANPQTIRWPNS